MKRWTLVSSNGELVLSDTPGQFGGHKRSRIYGRLDCPAALRALSKGGYVKERVFFIDEETARRAGYRPCFRCMPVRYREWKLPMGDKQLAHDVEAAQQAETEVFQPAMKGVA